MVNTTKSSAVVLYLVDIDLRKTFIFFYSDMRKVLWTAVVYLSMILDLILFNQAIGFV